MRWSASCDPDMLSWWRSVSILERRDLEESIRSFVVDVGVARAEPAEANGGAALGTIVEPKACTLPWPQEQREAYLAPNGNPMIWRQL